MKKRISILLPLLLALIIPAIAKELKTETVALPTLQCGSCKERIETKLTGLEGLESITIDLEKKEATIVFDSEVTSLAKIEQAISKIGYDAGEVKADEKSQKKLPTCCQPGGHEH